MDYAAVEEHDVAFVRFNGNFWQFITREKGVKSVVRLPAIPRAWLAVSSRRKWRFSISSPLWEPI